MERNYFTVFVFAIYVRLFKPVVCYTTRMVLHAGIHKLISGRIACEVTVPVQQNLNHPCLISTANSRLLYSEDVVQ